jgi:hypothetical protein
MTENDVIVTLFAIYLFVVGVGLLVSSINKQNEK